MSAKQWGQKTNIGLVARTGRYGSGTFAHKDIAFETREADVLDSRDGCVFCHRPFLVVALFSTSPIVLPGF